MKEYYINPVGTRNRIGPISEAALQQLLQNGTYSLNSLVWCEGMGNWQSANTVFPGLRPPLPENPAEIYAPAPQLPPQQPHQLPGAPRTPKGSAICGIIFGTLFCSIATVVLSIVSLCVGSRAKTLWQNRDFQGARNCARASASLMQWGWIAFIVNIICLIIKIAAC